MSKTADLDTIFKFFYIHMYSVYGWWPLSTLSLNETLIILTEVIIHPSQSKVMIVLHKML